MCKNRQPDVPPPIQPATVPGASAQLEPLTEEQLALRNRRNSSGITDSIRSAMMIQGSTPQPSQKIADRFARGEVPISIPWNF